MDVIKCVIKENLLYWNRKMPFEFTNNSVNQWINWFEGDTLTVRPLARARTGTSNIIGTCLTPIKLLN